MRKIFERASHLKPTNTRPLFSGKFGVIAAAAGSAVGLGNIWKFPYITGVYGGAAFLIVYIGFILAIGLPIMLSEMALGRKGRSDVFGVFKKLAPNKTWSYIGLLGIGAAFFINSFYGVVAGWSFEYIQLSFQNAFQDKTTAEFESMFFTFRDSPFKPILWQLLFMAITAAIVMGGVKKGIEKFSKILMPLLVVIIIILCVKSLTLDGASAGLKFLFKPDFTKLTAEGVLNALGHAFFSLSIGMGVMMTYGSYISKDDHLVNTAMVVTVADTIIAILAGIAIFPAVFAFGIEPSAGPGLVYITLPKVFQLMPGGHFFAVLFFFLLFIAALTSSISILEVIVAYFSEELKMSRKVAVITSTSLICVFGMLCSLSLNEQNVSFKFFGKSLFDIFDFTASNILLPIGGLCIAIFTGWIIGRGKIFRELTNNGTLKIRFFKLFIFLIKFIVPIAIALVFLYGVGLIKAN